MKATLSVPNIPVERFELACGALLLVSRRPDAPVCAAQVHLRGGHSLDPDGLDGTSYLTGRLVDQGTKHRTEEEIATTLETHGGSIDGGSTGLTGSIAGDEWKVLLELQTEMLTLPTYPRDKFERQQKRVLDRLLVEREDPRTQGGWLFRRLVYGKHWLGRPDYGRFETVEKITPKDLRAHHRKNWVARRAVIAFCGDVDPQAVKRFLDKRLADWNPGRDLPPANTDFPTVAPRTAVFRAERQQVHVYLGHLGIRRADPDYPALVVMDHVLGTGPGFTNRISMRLRDELGLAYTVHAAIHSHAGVLPGPFTAYIGTSPENVGTAVKGFLREIRLIQTELVEPHELELVKNYLTGSFALGFERAGRRAQHLVANERNGLPPGHLRDLVERFAAVDREEIRRVARKHLFPAKPCLAAAGPVTKKELDALLPDLRRRVRRSP